jgi:hypothetical protein
VTGGGRSAGGELRRDLVDLAEQSVQIADVLLQHLGQRRQRMLGACS